MSKKAAHPKRSENDEIIQQLTADLQRLQADFINYKTRAEKEKLDAVKLGRERAVSELLPVFDNLERAFSHAPEELTEHNWVKGIIGLEKQLVNVLSNLGLTKVETVGKPFDPVTMEAVGTEEGDGEEVVTEELQAGYLLDGRVVRPAMVKVRG